MLRQVSLVLRDLKLGNKFNLLLLLVFIGGVSLSGVAFANILNQGAQNEITSQALILLTTMNSVRNYTSTEVNPELAPRLATEFLPETVPAYSAREVFENFRQSAPYNDFFYKEATLNPTNLRDKADSFEATIVERFRQNSNLQEERGFRDTPAGQLFYIARPLVIKQESCLVCHSTPQAAPASLIERYGSENGFGWKLNEIIGAQIISVPASDVVNRAGQSLWLLLGIILVVFAAMILVVNWLLRRFVIRPITHLTRVAEQVSTGQMTAEFGHLPQDEVGKLAEAFTRMQVSLSMAMRMLDQLRQGKRNKSDG
uniref:histidine kinase n=1 Tax=Cyanothece sp. (strain PCC 7425 / ATCC 29141) TaxID=395961 RepID=B8HTZ8_CYAP4